MNGKELFWCNSHNREATFLKIIPSALSNSSYMCDPKLGGILIPCHVVDLTGIAEIINE